VAVKSCLKTELPIPTFFTLGKRKRLGKAINFDNSGKCDLGGLDKESSLVERTFE
jgi:hypothetical protein